MCIEYVNADLLYECLYVCICFLPASHISTIQQREYATKDGQNRFKPTLLGLALYEAYNNMGYQLTKPHLRAAMER